MDGGLVANNPTWEALSDILNLRGDDDDKISLVLSVGTGKAATPTKPKRKAPHHIWEFVRWEKARATDTKKAHEDMERYARKRDRTRVDKSTEPCGGHEKVSGTSFCYQRLDVADGLEGLKMDEWRWRSKWTRTRLPENKTVQRIEEATKAYLQQDLVKRQLEVLAERLVKDRVARSRTELWASVSTLSRWACHCADQRSFLLKSEFQTHLQQRHDGRAVTDEDKVQD